MLNLPDSTKLNKRIPKETLYKKLDVTPELKRKFVEQIKSITWTNKIATSTTNLAPGQTVVEVEVFEIDAKTKTIDESILRAIDALISYHILFVIRVENQYQLWIAYKEMSNSKMNFKVDSYYHTDWLDADKAFIKLEGFDLDTCYEGFVREVADTRLYAANEESLADSIERTKKIEKLLKKKESLQKRLHKEKQFNRQIEINTAIKELDRQLEGLTNG